MGCVAGGAIGPHAEFHKAYSLGARLGQGSFAEVRTATSSVTSAQRAVKILKVRGSNLKVPEELGLKAVQHEVAIWQQVGKHTHCVEFVDYFLTDGMCYMVMELCQASLMDRLEEILHMDELCLVRIFREMLLGIEYVHKKGIVHRDIKPNNFLFGSDPRHTIKLCDFGIAAALPKDGGLLPGAYGTAPYMSPEMVRNTGHTLSTDIWSMGAAAYVMLYASFPYMPPDPSIKSIKRAIHIGCPAPLFLASLRGGRRRSSLAGGFAKALLTRSPSDRPTAAQALELPFLTAVLTPDWPALCVAPPPHPKHAHRLAAAPAGNAGDASQVGAGSGDAGSGAAGLSEGGGAAPLSPSGCRALAPPAGHSHWHHSFVSTHSGGHSSLSVAGSVESAPEQEGDACTASSLQL